MASDPESEWVVTGWGASRWWRHARHGAPLGHVRFLSEKSERRPIRKTTLTHAAEENIRQGDARTVAKRVTTR